MLDGTIDGYEPYEAAVDGQTAEPLADRVAGTDMLYSSGTTGLPKGVARQFRAEPLETAASPVLGLLQLLFGVDRRRPSTCRRRRCTTPRRCASA